MYTLPKIERFNQNVLDKYQIYNSVFITLPFDEIDNTGVLLPLFSELCVNSFNQNLTPKEIVNSFSDKYLESVSEKEKIDLLFRFIQYIERQVVLFDAIEDAAFATVNNLEGSGSLREIKERVENTNLHEELISFLDEFSIRPVLTAHPTQFYPGSVLGIITDLTQAISENNLTEIKQLLAQLGKTPFFQKEKPSPFDEAVSLIWYLENVFYTTSGEMIEYLQKNIYKDKSINNSIIDLGFWPGGDRDGNPFVTTEITLKVANRLRTSILKCYYKDIRKLKRKLTFTGIESIVAEIENKIYRSVYYSDGTIYMTLPELLDKLNQIKQLVIDNHQSLYVDEIIDLINKVKTFGFHFATLDIRQNSRIHNQVFKNIIDYLSQADSSLSNYYSASDKEKIKVLNSISGKIKTSIFEDEITQKTIDSVYAIKKIQVENGELGANRYIISNNESTLNVLETLTMIQLCDWKKPTVDVVPLFESINDLKDAHKIMEELYTNSQYATHLKNRNNIQTIMLGFSDGTKDGGYLMANWSIFKAKETITEVSRRYGIKVIFFDGRGGPPSRGGGKTHKFYASLGTTIDNNEIQLTIQGQTISSNFGNLDSCRFNLENLLSAGISNQIFKNDFSDLSLDDKKIIDELSEIGYKKYFFTNSFCH